MRSLRTLLFIFILYSLSVAFGTEEEYVKDCDHAVTKRVAIIGSGIGGSSAAYFLHEKSKQLSDKVKFDITVFERDSIIGGRTRFYEPEDGVRVEIGASVFHRENYNIANFTAIFNLTTWEGPSLKTGIWDGSRFVFWESSWKFLNIINVLIRYGFSPKIAFDLADKVKDKYVALYHLKESQTWTSIRDFHSELGIWNLTMKSLEDDLKEHSVSQLCLDELISGATRVNYGQNVTMNALPGYITLVGHSNTVGVKEGLSNIPVHAIRASKANLNLNTAVTAISQLENSSYELFFNSTSQVFDIVILAAPIELANLKFEGVKIPYKESREFQVTHTTVVTGTLSNEYFHQTAHVELPGEILTTETSAVNFTSLAWKSSSKKFPNQNIYKLFSRQKLSEQVLDMMFTQRGNTFRKEWHAYPKYDKQMNEALDIVLSENLYYVNAAEFSFSVMEGESVNGENIANLIISGNK